MAPESVSTADGIEYEEGTDIGISGLISILNGRNYESTPSFSDLGKLTDVELRTIARQTSNVQAAALNGLRVVGDLTSSFDPRIGGFDHVSVGWLVRYLTETLETVLEIDASAALQLAERGYNRIGQPINKQFDRRLRA